jgi:hypothetical protein
MNKSVWGPCTWNVLHVLSMKIKESDFSSHKNKLIDMIIKICSHLPCPICSMHAKQLMGKYNIRRIQTKEGLVKTLFLIHNEVNKKLKKPHFEYEKIKNIYLSMNTRQVFTDYYNKYSVMNFGEKMMLYSFHRKLFLKQYKQFMQNHIHLFIE